jgi:hypothetical protein
MAFSPEVTEAAWNLSGQRCGCTRIGHGHEGVCNRPLAWENRCYDGVGGWEQRHRDPNGGDYAENCEILCHDCFMKIRYAEQAPAGHQVETEVTQ